jgi:hypothetical protein
MPAATQTAPVPKGLKVLTSGHSMHVWVGKWLRDVALSAGIKDHEFKAYWWSAPEVREALKEGKMDVLTLAVYKSPDGIEKIAEMGLAANPNLRVTIQEMWSPADGSWPGDPKNPWHTSIGDFDKMTIDLLRKIHEPYIKKFDDAVEAANKKLGKQVVFVVPVAQAVMALREKIIAGQAPGIEKQSDLFADGGGHPKPVLQALTAYCHYAVIYHRNPVGLPVLDEMKMPRVAEKDIAALNRLLQEIAWDAVIHHPLSGVTGRSSDASETRP